MVKKIGITGSNGFLGWHLKCYFLPIKDIEVVPFESEWFKDSFKFQKFAKQCDVVVHFAGLNRGDDNEIYKTNVGLAEKLIEACEAADAKPYIIFASSKHIIRDTAYGKSKKEAMEMFRNWAKKNSGQAANLILPNVYGENGKPFYNSAVATFCYQIARGEKPEVNEKGETELLHAQDLAKFIHGLIDKPQDSDIDLSGEKISIRKLFDVISRLKNSYVDSGTVPDFNNELERKLFSILIFELFDFYYPKYPEVHVDERGMLFEAIKSKIGGNVFFSTTRLGITRGNHYHTDKVERFCVLSGKAEINCQKLFSNEIKKFIVEGDKPVFVDIPPFYTHNIKNIGEKEMQCLFWSSKVFDPKDPDTYFLKIN